MSANFKEIPAEIWEQEFFGEELKEARKADKPLRVRASNFAAAFNALMEVGGIIAEAHQPLHIFLDKTRGCAPDEEIKFFSDKSAGALLPGETGVMDGSLRKRWVRAWQQIIEPEMARTGKRFAGIRKDGSIRLAARGTQATKTAPVYTSDIAQAIVDVARLADRARGKRDERFRRAALEVWAALPNYVAPEAKVKLKAAPEPRAKSLVGGRTRRMTRWHEVTKELIAEAEKDGESAVDALRARLHAELETMFADNEPCPLVNSLEWTENTPTEENGEVEDEEFVARTQSEVCENAEENCESDPSHVDSPVHVKPESDKKLHSSFECLSCQQFLTPAEAEINRELCEACRSPGGNVIEMEDFIT